MKLDNKIHLGIWGVKVTCTSNPKDMSVTLHMKVTRWKVYCWYIWMVLLGRGSRLIQLALLTLLAVLTGCTAPAPGHYHPLSIQVLDTAIPADSAAADGSCLDYWCDGNPGRLCAPYHLHPADE